MLKFFFNLSFYIWYGLFLLLSLKFGVDLSFCWYVLDFFVFLQAGFVQEGLDSFVQDLLVGMSFRRFFFLLYRCYFVSIAYVLYDVGLGVLDFFLYFDFICRDVLQRGSVVDIGFLFFILLSGFDLYFFDFGVFLRLYFFRFVCLFRLLFILENRLNFGLVFFLFVIFLKLVSVRWILFRSRVLVFCIFRLNRDFFLLVLFLILLFLFRVGLYLLRVSFSVLLYLLFVCLCILFSRRVFFCFKESLFGIILFLENRLDFKFSDFFIN